MTSRTLVAERQHLTYGLSAVGGACAGPAGCAEHAVAVAVPVVAGPAPTTRSPEQDPVPAAQQLGAS